MGALKYGWGRHLQAENVAHFRVISRRPEQFTLRHLAVTVLVDDAEDAAHPVANILLFWKPAA